LEKKLVLVKDHVGDIAIIMQSLIALIRPFKWNFITITFLSPEMIDYLDAPLPFLFGMSSHTWSQIYNTH